MDLGKSVLLSLIVRFVRLENGVKNTKVNTEDLQIVKKEMIE